MSSLTDTHLGYKNQIQYLLSFGQDVAKTHLRTEGWYMDEVKADGSLDDYFEEATATANAQSSSSAVASNDDSAASNDDDEAAETETQTPTVTNADAKKKKKIKSHAAKWRHNLIAKSKEIHLIGPMFSDFFHATKSFPPGNSVGIVLNKVLRDSFAFITGDDAYNDCKYKITDMYLDISQVNLVNHENQWNQGESVILPFKRNMVKVFTFPAGIQTLHIQSAATGSLPKSTAIVMVKDSAFSGAPDEDPFEFTDFGMRRITVIINGKEYPLPGGINVNLKENIYFEAYNSLFANTGYHNKNATCQISPEHFKKNCFIIPLDFSYDLTSGYYVRPPNQGQMSIEIRLAEKLDKAVTVIHVDVYDAAVDLNNIRTLVNSDI